ncbi:MAG: 50S ribosomal protein L24 [Patescibacteria group bacterium]|jgi:large subunit ribosomal protein L24
MVKKGDLVKILAGKDKNKTGKIESVLTKESKVVVTGLNMVKKHLKPNKYRTQAGIIDRAMPLDISNVMLVCPSCNRPSKVSTKKVDLNIIRICKKCNEQIDHSEKK